VQRLKFRAELVVGLRDAFVLLLGATAEQRWADAAKLDGGHRPTVGVHYLWRAGSRLRSGHIVECIRPVALTLAEVWLDPPSHVQLRLRYRLTPAPQGTLLQLDVGPTLNAAACLRRRYWTAEIARECAALLAALARTANDAQGTTACNGQNIGSSNMTVTKTTSVSGRPSLK
jgi:hypothetical protein